jgi:hypothetical protein
VKYNVEQKFFIYDSFVQRPSWRKWRTEFHSKYTDSTIHCNATIQNDITKFGFCGIERTCTDMYWLKRNMTILVLDWKHDRRSYISLSHLLSVSWKDALLKLVKIRPYKATVLHRLFTPNCEARIRYCRWFQESAFNGLLVQEFTFHLTKAWFTLYGYVNSQNNSHLSTEIPHALHEVPLHYQ